MPVLGAKLHRPVPRRRLVERARLTNQLRGCFGDQPRLVFVAAPAGFGKTTLLAQLVASEQAPRRVAWLALDRSDADPRVCVTGLVAALQAVAPEVGVDALAQLEAAPGPPSEPVLASLVTDLDVLADLTVIALDDYHVIDNADVHQAVTFLLDNLPRRSRWR